MIVLQLLGYAFLLVAAISSSVSMNFQKIAQHQTLYHDPRTRLQRRETPLTGRVCLRPMFILGLFLSAAASALDFAALTWLPPSTVGLFGCIAIGINLLVSRIVLHERPSGPEWKAVAWILLGCLMAISVKVNHVPTHSPPQLIERPQAVGFILGSWTCTILCATALYYAKLPTLLHQFGFPCIAGAIGAQNVCMGKYIAYAAAQAAETGAFTVRTDVLTSVSVLCLGSVVLGIVWLNEGLARYDGYYCIIVYQTTWFLCTTLSGIIVYDNMATLETWACAVFLTGCGVAVYGVWRMTTLQKE